MDFHALEKAEFSRGIPPFDTPLIIRGSWYGGNEYYEAMAKQYKKPKKGKQRRGFRYIKQDGEIVQHREIDGWIIKQ